MYGMTLIIVNLTGNDPVCNGGRFSAADHEANDNLLPR